MNRALVAACALLVLACGRDGRAGEFDRDAAVPDAGPQPDAALREDSGPPPPVDEPAAIAFVRRQLTDQFFAEGAAFADFDGDGEIDIVSGPFIYRGPDFAQTRRFKAGGVADVRSYSDNFFAFIYDFDEDGWADVLIIAFPGDHATWYRNPEGRDELWAAHRVFEEVDNESPAFEDLDGDGRPELVCNHLGDLGFAEVNWDDPTAPWTFVVVAEGSWGKFTHGLGVGDVNGDGRKDLILADGVWEQPLAPGDVWVAHPAVLSAPGTGGAQMFVDDVDGDGDADIITTLAAHGYGVAWYEQTTPWVFVERLISGSPEDLGPTGIALFEPHAITLVDLDDDGDLDIVAGERHWAHIPQDGRPFESPAQLVWFEQIARTGEYLAHVIDDRSGVGTQVMTGDVNGDGRLDVVLANKNGAFVFTQIPAP